MSPVIQSHQVLYGAKVTSSALLGRWASSGRARWLGNWSILGELPRVRCHTTHAIELQAVGWGPHAKSTLPWYLSGTSALKGPLGPKEQDSRAFQTAAALPACPLQ